MRPRRLHPLLIGLLLVSGLVVAPVAHAAGTVTSAMISAAEKTVFDLANVRRANAGLVSLKIDPRLSTLARARAEYMATTGTFSHTQVGGTTAFDLLSANGITWYAAGEIIAWNTTTDLDASADVAVRGWMASAGHKAIMLSKSYNYVGFGLGISPTTGKRYWAGVYLKGPDRTGAWAKVASTARTAVGTASTRLTVSWTGADTKLQVLTAGLATFQVQRRVDGGAWADVATTTATSISPTWPNGHRYEIRVRAKDKVGNWGSWNGVTVTF